MKKWFDDMKFFNPSLNQLANIWVTPPAHHWFNVKQADIYMV
jgi:hypothetical protein